MNERLHTGITYLDGTTALSCPRNPDQVAWELWANQKGLNLADRRSTALTSLTFQAWHALRRTGGNPGKFETWSDTVDEVYPADADGNRLRTDKAGHLVRPDGSPWTIEPDPTQPAPDSGN